MIRISSSSSILARRLLFPIITLFMYICIVQFEKQDKIVNGITKILPNNFRDDEMFVGVSGFQRVSGEDELYIYSAFHLKNEKDAYAKVRITGFAKTNTSGSFTCRFAIILSDGWTFMEETKAVMLWSNSSTPVSIMYSSVLIDCEVIEGTPKFVSLYAEDSKSKTNNPEDNLLQIQYNPSPRKSGKSSYRYQIAACVKHLYTWENWTDTNPIGLIEWIEFQKMMGVEHFTFYNLSGSSIFIKVLESYGDEIAILPWNIPFIERHEIGSKGQYVEMNDCSYRYRGVAKFLSTLDIDEFLIPAGKGVANYSQLFRKILKRKDTMKLGGVDKIFEFKFNGFFSFTNWRKEANFNQTDLKLTMMTNFLGSNQTKFVELPENVMESGIHAVRQGVLGTVSYKVPNSVAYYLHYRPCTSFFQKENPTLLHGGTCLQNITKTISNMEPGKRFGEKLGYRVRRKMKELAEASGNSEFIQYLDGKI